jgi:hypothetical protein
MTKLKKTSTPHLERSEVDDVIAVSAQDVRAIRLAQYTARMQRLLEVKAILERELGRDND